MKFNSIGVAFMLLVPWHWCLMWCGQPPLSAWCPNYLVVLFSNLFVDKRYFWNLPSFSF